MANIQSTTQDWLRPAYHAPGLSIQRRDTPVTWALKSSSSSSYKYTATPLNLGGLIDSRTFIYHKFTFDISITFSSFSPTDPDWWGNAEGGYDADYCPGMFESPVTPTGAYPEASIGDRGTSVIGIDCRKQEEVDAAASSTNVPKLALIIEDGGSTHNFTCSTDWAGAPTTIEALGAMSFELNIHEAQFQPGNISSVTINTSTLESLFVRQLAVGEST